MFRRWCGSAKLPSRATRTHRSAWAWHTKLALASPRTTRKGLRGSAERVKRKLLVIRSHINFAARAQWWLREILGIRRPNGFQESLISDKLPWFSLNVLPCNGFVRIGIGLLTFWTSDIEGLALG